MRRNKALVAILLVFLLSNTQHNMMRPFVPLYAASLGVGYLGVGIVVAALAFLPIILGVPAGIVTDRRGVRPMLLMGASTSSAGYLVLATIPSLPAIIISQLMAGVGNLLVVVAAQTYIGSLGRGAAAERNFSTYSLVASFGQIVGPIAGGLAAGGLGYRSAFAIAAGLAAAAAISTVVIPNRGTPQRGGAPQPTAHPTSAYLRSSDTVLAIMVSCLMSVPEVLRVAFLPMYLEASIGLDLREVGYALAAFSVAGLLAKAMLPFLASKVGRFRLLVCICIATAGALIAIPSSATVVLVTCWICLVGFAFGVGRPLSMAMAANSARPEDMGRVIGIRLTGNRVADFVLPMLFGLAAGIAGVAAAFYLGAAMLLAGIPPLIRAGLRNRNDDASND